MSDNKSLSALADITASRSGVASGSLADASELATWMADVESRLADLNDAITDEANNRAGASAPTDNTVEGQIRCNTTPNPATLLFDPDGSGADIQLLSITEDGSVWPSFRVNLNGNDQLNITSAQKIAWDTEVFDTNSDFDKDTNNRFTPTVAGKYLLIANLTWNGVSITDADNLHLHIYKNGAVLAHNTIIATGADGQTHSVSIIDDANGTTDYYEVFAENADRNTSDVDGGTNDTFFCGSRIA